MTQVKSEQFDIKSDIEVVHKPTGATFSTYRYENPEDAVSAVTINWGRAGDVLSNGDDYAREDVKSIACELLLGQARKARKSGAATD